MTEKGLQKVYVRDKIFRAMRRIMRFQDGILQNLVGMRPRVAKLRP